MYEEFFPKRLTELRMQKGVSARDMSLSLGQADNYINAIENRKTFPSMASFFYICEYLGVTPEEFFSEGNRYPEKLNALVTNLQKLDEKALTHISGIVQEILAK